jgi:hypothetical protein
MGAVETRARPLRGQRRSEVPLAARPLADGQAFSEPCDDRLADDCYVRRVPLARGARARATRLTLGVAIGAIRSTDWS